MRVERETWVAYWQDLARFYLPARARFLTTDNNRGDRRNQHIIDSTATVASRTLASGMMSGITNPARPWFRLTVPDPELQDVDAVKRWLHDVTVRMNMVLARSNWYQQLPIHYQDLGVFGTAALLIEEDEDDIIRCQSFPIGSYFIANDAYGRVRTFAREFTLSVAQVVQQFGADNPNYSQSLRSLIAAKSWRDSITLCHLVTGNPEADGIAEAAPFKPFVSYYWESGTGRNDEGPGNTRGFLRVSGYDEFPVMASRWATAGDESYATDCPGMVALGDVRQLQLGVRRLMQAAEKQISPPMQIPAAMRNNKLSFAPADVNVNPTPGQKAEPMYDVRFDLGSWDAILGQLRQRINTTLYADLFLMLALDTRNERATAREIQERHEEKLLALGPVLERLNTDLLDPAIDRVFNIMARRGLLPEAPPELEGMQLRVEYISLMSQAQKLVGVGGMERFASTVTMMAANAQSPAMLDKLDMDQWVDEYGEMMGVPPTVIRSDADVQAMREAQAQAAQAQAQAEQAKLQAEAVQKLSQTDTSTPNALTDILGLGGSLPQSAGVV